MSDIVARLRQGIADRGAERLMDEAAAEIERLGALAAIVREQGFEIERLKAQAVTDWIKHGDEIERLRAALHNIGIGGNGERNWTLDEVRAVAWDALQP